MKKILAFISIFVTLTFISNSNVFAQGMMGFSGSSPDNAAIQSQQQEEQEGKKFLDNLNNKTVTCSQLKDADFEKIGEYFMGQSIGDTSRHIAMNEMMKSMMGEQGEEKMHVTWGKRGSGCDTSATFPSQGGGNNMTGLGMMGGIYQGFNTYPILAGVLWIAAFTFLISGTVFFLRRMRK